MVDKARTGVSVNLPPEKRKALNKLAAKTGIPVAAIVRNLIYQKLEEEN